MTINATLPEASTAARILPELAAQARGLRYENLSAEAVEVAKHCLLDWLGVTLAGSREPLADILFEEIARSSADESSLIGRNGIRASALEAALINGAASHALDFDDTHLVMSGHPSVPVIPAALALAEREKRSGRQLLTAIVAGIELECRLGAVLNPAHYQAGFHATGTLGTFGAATAAAHLLDLPADRWLHALGLAGTQAAGLKSSFGTMAKPLHAGKAAYEGLLSALLAARGFTGNPDILEAHQGFADTHGAGASERTALWPANGFLVCDTLFKYNAACYLTHSVIEGAKEIRDSQGVDSKTVDRVVLEVAPASLKVCNIGAPKTGLEGKFSLRTTTAMSLLGDRMSDLAVYSDQRVQSPEVVAMRDRIEVRPTPGTSPTHSKVLVFTSLGGRHEASVDVGEPDRDLRRQWRRLSAKFLALAVPVVGASRSEALLDMAHQIDEVDDLGRFLAAASP